MRCECNDAIGGRLTKLYRDRDNAMLFGVCAGVAHYFDVNVLAVRVATVALALFFFFPTVLVYVVATLLMRERSLDRCICRREREFWARGGRDYEAY